MLRWAKTLANRDRAELGSVGDMRVSLTPKAMVAALVAAGLCLGFGGCGVRGSLDPPPSAAGTAKSAEAAGTQPESAAPPKPHDGFILDPLLR